MPNEDERNVINYFQYIVWKSDQASCPPFVHSSGHREIEGERICAKEG